MERPLAIHCAPEGCWVEASQGEAVALLAYLYQQRIYGVRRVATSGGERVRFTFSGVDPIMLRRVLDAWSAGSLRLPEAG